MSDLPSLDSMPKPPQGSVFSLLKVEKVSLPHPYCITPEHVSVASDDFGGILSADAIRAAEKSGAKCEICVKSKKRPVLSFDEHTVKTTLFINVPQNQDLNSISGLVTYLVQFKQEFIALGVEGFAFPIAEKAK